MFQSSELFLHELCFHLVVKTHAVTLNKKKLKNYTSSTVVAE